MAASDQQRLEALQDTYLRLAQMDVAQASEGIRSMGFRSLKEMGDEIERLESKVARAGGRSIFRPMSRTPR